MDFGAEKAVALAKPDRSRKGSVDVGISELVELLNSQPSYYTTSSCAGRITVLREGRKKADRAIVRVWHEPIRTRVELPQLLSLSRQREHRSLWFRFEPAILHVACRDLAAAQRLIKLCRLAGLKKSGIMEFGRRIIVEIVGPEHIEAPLRAVIGKRYLSSLIAAANKKLLQNEKRIAALCKSFEQRKI